MKRPSLQFIAVLLLFLAVVASSSCGVESTPDPTVLSVSAPTPVNVEQLLRDAGAATAGLETFHFLLEHNTGGTPLAPNLTVTEAKGNIVNPDGISTEFAGTLGTFAVRSSLITLGDESYMTNPLTGAWESVPKEVSPLGFFDPQSGIGAIMTQVVNPNLLAIREGEIRVGGSLPVAALESILGSATDGTTVEAELTIDAKTLFLTEAILTGRVTATEPDGVIRTITLSKFNQPLTIVAPQ